MNAYDTVTSLYGASRDRQLGSGWNGPSLEPWNGKGAIPVHRCCPGAQYAADGAPSLRCLVRVCALCETCGIPSRAYRAGARSRNAYTKRTGHVTAARPQAAPTAASSLRQARHPSTVNPSGHAWTTAQHRLRTRQPRRCAQMRQAPSDRPWAARPRGSRT